MNKYELLDKTSYNKLLSSGFFWELFPELTGNFEEDYKLINESEKEREENDKTDRLIWLVEKLNEQTMLLTMDYLPFKHKNRIRSTIVKLKKRIKELTEEVTE